jgi:hypothetical protein
MALLCGTGLGVVSIDRLCLSITMSETNEFRTSSSAQGVLLSGTPLDSSSESGRSGAVGFFRAQFKVDHYASSQTLKARRTTNRSVHAPHQANAVVLSGTGTLARILNIKASSKEARRGGDFGGLGSGRRPAIIALPTRGNGGASKSPSALLRTLYGRSFPVSRRVSQSHVRRALQALSGALSYPHA